MNQEKYFSISKKKDLPYRCPIIGICERWMQTVFFFKYYHSKSYQKTNFFEHLINDGTIPRDIETRIIKITVNQPEFLRTDDRISYRNMCPEVNLFDREIGIEYAKNTASISGEIDEHRGDLGQEYFKNYEEKHYTECVEFSNFIFENLDKKKISRFYLEKRKKRTPISNKLRFEIFQRDKFKCQYCGRTISDDIRLEIDHIKPIAEGGTDDYHNLITSCNECNKGKSNKVIS